MGAAARKPALAIRLRRRFASPREKVFRAWTQPETLKRWWCPKGWTPAEIEIDLRVGGTYRIGMRRLSGGAPIYVRGRFLEVRPPEKLVYTWHWDGAFEQMPETQVAVEFLEIGSKTDVILTHEAFSDLVLRHEHRNGWIEACNRMERIL
jgi:uncharacterized protein YndB with AHSA1/START domain